MLQFIKKLVFSWQFWTTVIVTGILLSILTLSYSVGKKHQKAEDYILQVELERKVDSLNNIIIQTERVSVDVLHIRDSLNMELKLREHKLQQLSKKYNEKVQDIINYSNPELEHFFNKRYSTGN